MLACSQGACAVPDYDESSSKRSSPSSASLGLEGPSGANRNTPSGHGVEETTVKGMRYAPKRKSRTAASVSEHASKTTLVPLPSGDWALTPSQSAGG